MNTLQEYAQAGMQIVIPAAALMQYLADDRTETFHEGIREGIRIAEAKRVQGLETPLTKKEAAHALGVSERTIDNLRSRGELESLDYGDKVLFEVEEILRYKRTHRSIRAQINNNLLTH